MMKKLSNLTLFILIALLLFPQITTYCDDDNKEFNKKKEQFMAAVAEERRQLSERADRRYSHITSIIKRNPNAVSRVHKESINEIKEIIANRKAKKDN